MIIDLEDLGGEIELLVHFNYVLEQNVNSGLVSVGIVNTPFLED